LALEPEALMYADYYRLIARLCHYIHMGVIKNLSPVSSRVTRFFLIQPTKKGKIYQMATKYTKWPQNIPNGRKIDQMAKNVHTNNFYCKTLQNLPKFGFLV
jgi:hypothetical protein